MLWGYPYTLGVADDRSLIPHTREDYEQRKKETAAQKLAQSFHKLSENRAKANSSETATVPKDAVNAAAVNAAIKAIKGADQYVTADVKNIVGAKVTGGASSDPSRDSENLIKAVSKSASKSSAQKTSSLVSNSAKKEIDEKKETQPEQVERQVVEIVVKYPDQANQIVDAANAAQNDAYYQEQVETLPTVEVKSDFKKWLFIGGGVLVALYLLRGE